ncbi:ATP-binding protein [Streptococcus sp. NLN64]|uniref:ATP-binding protein n=1 Tax=Streptococcus sp. NLN64 TaxID=2822799 RepID=UPI0018CAB9B1|nr:ATP-binding protein [Streptococcus sp. NLN64]MBG9367461.1 ATP-binding protein [Streptococcus sp. NLN64]
MTNPFTLGFGKKPLTYIDRTAQTTTIIEDLTSDNPSSQSYILTGVRGVGKTVMMNEIVRHLNQKSDWITIKLNPNRPLFESLAAKLYEIPEISALFHKAKLNLSIFGLGVDVENVPPVVSIEVALEKMLLQLKENNKKLLIAIDEVTKSDNLKAFVSSFQLWISDDLPVFLLMTGLYENISLLQDDSSLTFLHRSKKEYLSPLNYLFITKSYKEIFDLSDEEAIEMSRLTRGFPFAFQVLGYLKWNEKEKALVELLDAFDDYLQEYVYNKIWSELSDLDRDVLKAFLDSPRNEVPVSQLRDQLEFSANKFSVYRERLIRKGVVHPSKRGYLELTLPRFRDFLKHMTLYDF